jgi:hypothetical protein
LNGFRKYPDISNNSGSGGKEGADEVKKSKPWWDGLPPRGKSQTRGKSAVKRPRSRMADGVSKRRGDELPVDKHILIQHGLQQEQEQQEQEESGAGEDEMGAGGQEQGEDGEPNQSVMPGAAALATASVMRGVFNERCVEGLRRSPHALKTVRAMAAKSVSFDPLAPPRTLLKRYVCRVFDSVLCYGYLAQ